MRATPTSSLTTSDFGRLMERAVRARYTCQTKSRTHGECDGQTGYTVEKLDAIIDHILHFIFSKVRRLDRQDVLNVCYQNDLTEKTATLKNYVWTIPPPKRTIKC